MTGDLAMPVRRVLTLSLVLAAAGACSPADPAPADTAPVATSAGVGSILRLDPAFDALVPAEAAVE